MHLTRQNTVASADPGENPKVARRTTKALSDFSERAFDLHFRAIGGGGRI
jgi:hypothetical protein